MEVLLLILFYIFVPALIIFVANKYPIIDKIGTVVIAYAFGLVLGNLVDFSPAGKQVQDITAMVTVALSLPLLLFSSDIKAWLRLAPKILFAMMVSIAGLLIIIVIGNQLFAHKIPEVWKISGMLVGVYTGGTPNLAALKLALNVDETSYILIHTYDTIISAIFILFLITIGQRIFLLFLKPFDRKNCKHCNNTDNQNITYSEITNKSGIKKLLTALGIAIAIVAIGGGVSMLVPEDISTTVSILLITTLGIAASLIPSVNKIESSFQAGMYLILIFSLDVASMADLSHLNIASLYLLYYIILAIFGTLIFQLILSRIFKIDADTTIILLTTLICSPPFVPMVAGALKNKQIIISGLTVGIIGFAIGNYLGILLAWLLQ